MNKSKVTVVSIALAVLGVAMIVLGSLGGIVPPILTGVGFLVIAWGLR